MDISTVETQDNCPVTEFKRIFYTLTCDECGKEVAINLEIDQFLDSALPQHSPHRRKREGYQGGLWSHTQTQIIRHHSTHTIPEPVDSDGLTEHQRRMDAMR